MQGRCALCSFALGAALCLIRLLQRPLDAAEEEGVLLNALLLEVVLELLKQLRGHLEGSGPLIFLHYGAIGLHTGYQLKLRRSPKANWPS